VRLSFDNKILFTHAVDEHIDTIVTLSYKLLLLG